MQGTAILREDVVIRVLRVFYGDGAGALCGTTMRITFCGGSIRSNACIDRANRFFGFGFAYFYVGDGFQGRSHVRMNYGQVALYYVLVSQVVYARNYRPIAFVFYYGALDRRLVVDARNSIFFLRNYRGIFYYRAAYVA